VNMLHQTEWMKDVENPMLGYDAKSGRVILLFTFIDRHVGGCDEGILTESGFQMVVSTDRWIIMTQPPCCHFAQLTAGYRI
jgi:hypothetical protein